MSKNVADPDDPQNKFDYKKLEQKIYPKRDALNDENFTKIT